MIKVEDDGLFKIFPSVETISQTFEYQNILLNKIVLTGKINALDIAENLFNFTEQTAKTFSVLQTKLIESLLAENKKELLDKTKLKAKTAINTINDMLKKRMVDVELLSNDRVLIELLEGESDKHTASKRLQDFVNKYSIYDEVVVVDNNGKIRANANEANGAKFTKDEFLYKASQKEECLVVYGKTDIFPKQKESLYFIKVIKNNEKILGYVVAFFKFKDEMKAIFDALIEGRENIIIVSKNGDIIASSEKGVDKKVIQRVGRSKEYAIIKDRFYVQAKGDEENQGVGWRCVVSYPKEQDLNLLAEFSEQKVDNKELAQIHLNNKELQKLADEGYEILEDLSDVIINGELIAAKSKQYILIPILDNLREVSFKVVKLIEISIDRLQKSIDKALVNYVVSLSKLTMDIIQRDLYEKGNNVRWWAVDLIVLQEMKKDTPDVSKIGAFLSEMNNIYPMYSSIFVFNAKKEIIASSNEKHIGKTVPHNFSLNNKNGNKYYVSAFEDSELYDGKPTYIYYAPLVCDGRVVGGVGAVFDAEIVFEKMLTNSLCSTKPGFVLLVDKAKRVISSTSPKYKILSEFYIDGVELEDGFVGNIKIDNKSYKASVTQSVGYREYKNKDLYSVAFVEV